MRFNTLNCLGVHEYECDRQRDKQTDRRTEPLLEIGLMTHS